MSDAFDDGQQPQQPVAQPQTQAQAQVPAQATASAQGDAFDQTPTENKTPEFKPPQVPSLTQTIGEKALNLEGKALSWILPEDNSVLSWVNKHVVQPPVRMGKEAGNLAVQRGLAGLDKAMHLPERGTDAPDENSISFRRARVESEHPELAGVTASILDTTGNLAGNPTNWPLLGATAAKSALMRTFTKAFGYQMAKDTLEEASDLWENWGQMDAETKSRRVTDLITHAYFSKKSLEHGSPKKEETQAKKTQRVVGEKPTETQIAGVVTPLSSQHAASIAGDKNAPVDATQRGLHDIKEFQRNQTAPAATSAMHSVLGQSAEDLINSHDSIVNSSSLPEKVAGTNTPSKYQTIDDAANALNEKARSTTYAKADEISEREQQQHEQAVKTALEAEKAGIDHYNELVDEHNSQLGEGETPMEHQTFDPSRVSLPERPKTYGELKGALDRANSDLKSPDAQVRENAVDARDKAEKALDQWFKQHSDEISPEEYSSAKKLVYAGARFQEVANGIRAGIENDNLTGNKLRSIIASIDNRMIKRGEAPGAFRRLVGDDVYQNWRDVARLFDPIQGAPSGARTLGRLALHFAAHHFFGPLGLAGKVGMHWLLDRALSTPAWGDWFKDLTDSVHQKYANGKEIPSRVLDMFKALWKNERGTAAAPGRVPLTPEDEEALTRRESRGDAFEPEDKQVTAHHENGGSTFDINGKDLSGSDKYSVGSYPERSETHPELTADVLQKFRDKNADVLRQPDHAVGTWKDGNDHVLDISRLYGDRDAAIAEGQKANQKAIYHLGTGELIDTGGTGEKPLELHHWSSTPDLTETNPEFMGSGKAGREMARSKEPGFLKRTNFALDGYKEPAVQSQKFHYVASVNPSEYYDAAEDPKGIWQRAYQEGGPTAAENAVKAAGYKGYRVGHEVAAFDKVPVKSAGASVTTNASGESAASQEAINRQASEKSQGIQRVKILRNGQEVPLIGPDAVDAVAGPGETVVKRFSDGHEEIQNQGKGARYNPRDPQAEAMKKLVTTNDNDWMTQARAKLGPDASFSQVAMEAAKLKAAAVETPDLEASEIATRRPTSTRVEKTNATGQYADMDGVRAASEAMPSSSGKLGYAEKLSRTIQKYSGLTFTPEEIKKPQAVFEKVINHMTDNLVALHDAMPESMRETARNWYDTAHTMAKTMADQYKVTHEQAAGVLAALSPQNAGDNNVALADRLLDTYKNRQSFKFSPKMEAAVAKVKQGQLSKAGHGILRDIHGKTLKEIAVQTMPERLRKKWGADADAKWENVKAAQQAMWVRLYDEAHNSSENPMFHPSGDVVGVSPSNRSWIGLDHIAKAIRIINDGSPEAINRVMGDGNKIRNFYNNIINPNSKNGHVTVDTHAVGAAHFQPFSGDDAEVQHNFGNSPKGIPGAPKHAATGMRGTYPLYAEAYRRAAERLGVQPRELQSMTWEGIRSLMGDDKKTPELKAFAKDTWQKVQDKELTVKQAREMIIEKAGGFSKPSWMTDEQWDESTGASFNPEEFAEAK